MGLRAVVLGVSLVLLALLVYWQRPTGELTEPRNALLVFVLFNLNIVVLSVLAFLIGRNVVKLVFDRKRRIIGSRLKLKLVAAFVGLTLIPTSFVFVLAGGLLNQAMDRYPGRLSSGDFTSRCFENRAVPPHSVWRKESNQDSFPKTLLSGFSEVLRIAVVRRISLALECGVLMVR